MPRAPWSSYAITWSNGTDGSHPRSLIPTTDWPHTPPPIPRSARKNTSPVGGDDELSLSFPCLLSFPSLLWLPFHFPKVATFPAIHLVNANYEGVKKNIQGKTVNFFHWYVWSTHNQHFWKIRQHLQTFGNAVNPKQSSLFGGHLSCRRVLFSQDTRFTIRWRRQISESDHRLVQAGLKTTDLGVSEIHLIQYITDLFK